MQLLSRGNSLPSCRHSTQITPMRRHIVQSVAFHGRGKAKRELWSLQTPCPDCAAPFQRGSSPRNGNPPGLFFPAVRWVLVLQLQSNLGSRT